MANAKKIFPLVLLGLACIPAWGQSKNASTNNPQVFDAPRVTVPDADSGAQGVNPSTYLIGPEDVLKIEVYKDPEMSRVVNVRPDGKITLLLVGDIQAEGLTPERLQAQVKEAISQFNNNPQVTVSVMAVLSKSFTVSGKVNRSGKWPLVTPLRVFDAITLAGGFQDFAKEDKVLIIHANGTTSEFNYKDFLKRKKKAIDQNILLQTGDAIVVK